MIGVPGGAVEFRGVGDPLGNHDPDAVIESIGPSSIDVARGDETTELKTEAGY
ncbi:MAG: hypothetical protein AAF266_02210 [Planctomycetota bacterium]